jgi:spermidine/putrescine transport system permease protein
MRIMRALASYSLPVFVFMSYLFMYIPIIVLVIFSFNSGHSTHHWQEFSFRWYRELFASVEIIDALKNSLIVAFSAVILSILMGLFFVFYGTSSFLKNCLFFFYGSLAAPEVVLAVGLLSIFSFFSVPLGLTTLIAAHTLVGLSYVTPILYSRFTGLDPRLIEASLDLGATEGQTFVRIILPLLYPAIISASFLVFIISFDDFILSFFCAGSSVVTLPMYIFAVIRSGATPVVNALSTLLLLISSIVVLIVTSFRVRTRMF